MNIPAVITVPLREDEAGAIRIGDSRLLLEVIIQRYNAGDSPEALAEAFDSITLEEIYLVIAYYLGHRDEVDRYVAQMAEKAAQWRQVADSMMNRP